MATATETREIIERLRAVVTIDERDVARAYLGVKGYDPTSALKLRDSLINLLERSDPSEWTDEQLREYGLARLPRDKDGEVCHIGDTVWDVYGDEWNIYDVRINYAQVFLDKHDTNLTRIANPATVTHRPPVTVESVLREFGDKYIQVVESPNPIVGFGNEIIGEEDPEKTIAEYAKRLQLATEVKK